MAAKPPPISRVELSRLLGVDVTTIDRWRRTGLPEVDHKGRGSRYDLAEVFHWRLERERELVQLDDAAIDLELYRKRKMKADTELVELELDEARGKLVAIDIVEDVVGAILDNVRAKLLAFPGRYASRLANKTAAKAKGVLRDATREALQELADGGAVAKRSREAARDRRR